MISNTTCEAAWEGGRCDRKAAYQTPRGKVCMAHYQQIQRGKPFRALRGVHGSLDDGEVSAPETVRVPRRYREAAQAEAKATGVDRAEVYRRAIAAYFDRT